MSLEFKMVYDLNFETLDEQKYFQINDDESVGEGFVGRNDFDPESFDLLPSADPEVSLDIQRVTMAQAAMEMSGRTDMDEVALTRNYLRAIKVSPKEVMYSEENPAPQPPPNPEIEFRKMELQIESQKLEIEAEKIKNEGFLLRQKAGLEGVKAEEMKEKMHKTYAETQKIIKETSLLTNKTESKKVD